MTMVFYTQISIAVQPVDVNYSLMRLDDSSEQWQTIEESITVGAGEEYSYCDYGGLYLYTFPQYKVKAFSLGGDLIAESEAVEGFAYAE